MSLLFEPKIEIEGAINLPNSWQDSMGIRLPGDFVMSRHRDGSVASLRKDLRWDWSAYHPTGKSIASSFTYWVRGKDGNKANVKVIDIPEERKLRVDDIQHLMTLIIYKKPGGLIGVEMLRKLSGLLCNIALYADNHDLQVPEVLGDPKYLSTYCRTLPNHHCAEFIQFIGILIALNPESDIGFNIAGNEVIRDLKKRARTHINGHKQTPPIPSRIYSEIIENIAAELNEFDAIASNYLKLVLHYFGGGLKRQANGNHDITAKELIRKYGLDNYFEAKSLNKSHSGISMGLTQVQIVCKLTLHVFSGMRSQEVLSLPYHCTEIEKSHGRMHFILIGQTTKLNKGKIRRTKWVTVDEGHRSVEIARKIADVIYKIIGETPRQSSELLNSYPLFISTGYLGVSGFRPKNKSGIYQVNAIGTISDNSHAYLKARLSPLIEEIDLCELEDIDPHRAWRGEGDFQVGRYWSLRSHQFRRSLALYAQRSGLVSLPSLRRQLQHITKEMSLYYSKGSSFARNFIEDDPNDYAQHICKEWREAKPVSEALTFLRDIVFAKEELFGGGGAFEQQKKNRGQVADREMTIKQFKKGVIGYKEIPFGACIKAGECDKVGLKIVGVLCLTECKNIVVKMPNLNSVIMRQTNLVDSLDKMSVTYRMEKDDLDSMLEARNKWKVASVEKEHV